MAKLSWSKLGESDRQINDVAGVVRMQGEALDRSYIQRWVDELELHSQWQAALERAG